MLDILRKCESNWITIIQNSLFTNKFTDLLTFTKLSKNKGEVIKFAEQLGNGSTRFYLNESTIPDLEILNCTLK